MTITDSSVTILTNDSCATSEAKLADNEQCECAQCSEFGEHNQRFTILSRLGGGGGGSVFLAHDNQLQRKVAIKMLSSERSLTNQALLAEARMQAKIDHPNICKIYQVEEANDHNPTSYLVIQHIPGMSAMQWLKQQGTAVSATDIIVLMQKVCDGLQAMHANGIVHRDIKPDNIMIDISGANGPEPYMVDFGLANLGDIDSDSDNSSHAGTPTFMAPEQWQNGNLDCRTDVYSFGATLYLLLTGIKPKLANSGAEFADQFTIPQWLSLPQELRAIIPKCMDQARENRYQSGRELNRELQRYLVGDPVRCIPSKRYWFKKQLLKYKWQTALAFVVLIGSLSAVIWQQHQQHLQQQREQILTRFTSRFESLEANVRLAKMAVAHDISNETRQWQQQIDTLNHEIKALGKHAYGPGHYAIGRMYYSLQQFDLALAHLQKAWDSGFNQPRVAYTLALSHGAIYQRQKTLLNNILSNTAKADKLALLNQAHRQPAIDYLTKGMGDSPYQFFAKALLQYYQGEINQALLTLDQGADLPSWFYLHHELRGDLYLAKTEIAAASHIDAEVQANAALALANYGKAAQMGRSDLQLQLKPLSVYIQLLNNSLFGKQQDFLSLYQQAETVLDYASTLHPNTYLIPMLKGQLLSKKSEYEEQHSGTPTISRQQAIEQFEHALAQDQNNADILLALGLSYSQKIRLMQQQNQAVTHLFNKALKTFESIPAINRDYAYFSYLALLQHEMAINIIEQSKGLTQSASFFEQAIASYQLAIEKKPDAIAPYLNMGIVYRDWAVRLPPESAKQKQLLAIAGYQQASKLNASHFVLNFNLAQSYSALSRLNGFLLSPMDTEIAMGKQYLAVANQAHPDHPFILLERANLSVSEAINNWQKGKAFNPAFERAKQLIEQSLVTNPDNAVLLDGRSWIYTKEQQVLYFAKGPQILTNVSYIKALSASKLIISGRKEQQILLALMNNRYRDYTEQTLKTLPVTDEASLSYAEWLSQNGQFEQAESMFSAIRREFPIIIWSYRLQHLARWQHTLGDSAKDRNTMQKLAAQVIEYNNLIRVNFPLLIHKKTSKDD